MSSSRGAAARFWMLLIAGLILVAIVVGGAGGDGPPLDPRSVNPDGARALVEVLEDLGATVRLDDAVPPAETTHALILQDRLSEADADAVQRWVELGGVLVVADPSSRFAARTSGFAPDVVEAGACSVDALAQARSVTAGGRTFDAAGIEGCFGSVDRSYVVVEEAGLGVTVSIGGPSLFTNEALDDQDNAFVAVTLLAPRPDEVSIAVIAPSTVDFGDQSLDDLVPTRLTNAILQLLAAFLLYALFRMRRLGAVVDEPLPVRIRGSELVLQAGVLSERAEDPAGAAAVIRDDFVDRWRRTLAIDTSDLGELASNVATVVGVEPEPLQSALIAPVATDADLLDVVHQLDLVDRAQRSRLASTKGSSR